MALAPGFLGAIVAMAGLALIGTDGYVWIDYSVAILAAITGWFAVQGRQWWWAAVMAAVVVLWNPVFPLALPGVVLSGLSIAAAASFIACGVLVRVTPGS